MTKTIYLNLEDDITKVVDKLKREKGDEVVLVFPKKSFIFSDSINLRLLKKQIDMLNKKVFILTMDERGQNYAQEAGFELKRMPKTQRAQSFSDIRRRTTPAPKTVAVMSTGFDPEPVEMPEPAEIAPKRKRTAVLKTPSKISKVAAAPLEPVTAKSKSIKRPNVRISDAAELPVTHVEKQENFFLPPDEKIIAPTHKRKTYRAYVVGFVALALIIILLLLLVVLPSANVVIYAKSQSVSRDIDVIADVKTQTADSSKLMVPAVAVSETQTITDKFQAKGKKELGSKAEGRVAIYNLTGSPMALKASTTTLTVGSKSYVFKSDQGNVRPVANASNDASATVADIIATDGGESFNVPAGTRVEITNQAFGSQPQRLYAKTVTQVIGGNSRFVSVVAKEDLAEAQTQLSKKLVENINAKIGSGAKLVEGAYTINVTSFVPNIPEGTESQNFDAELQATITGLAFDEVQLKNMIRQRLLMSLGAGKELQEVGSDTVIYQIKNLDAPNGLMQLALHYESNAKPRIEYSDLQNKLAGKSKQEASDLLLANSDIEKVEITVQPVWQRSLPRFGSKIQLEVRN